MIILSGPWLSSHFIETVVGNGWPLVDAGGAAELLEGSGAMLLEPGVAARDYCLRPGGRVLTSGEQALEWVTRELRGTEEARGARLFKDKTEFRRLMKPDYPELAFRELPLAKISAYVPEPGFYPFVIKPAVGFFSIGVHTVHSPEEWHKVRAQIAFEISSARRHFPEHMLSQERLLLESFIDGEEFAVDAYFDDEGNPIVLNVLEHRFASLQDVSDRLYVSSQQIVESIGPLAREFLVGVNRACGLTRFPLHAEFRRTATGKLVPIEINPLRFGGWCTTGDFAYFAWGFNSYELYMRDEEPDWAAAFSGREGNELGLIVLDNSTGIAGEDIEFFDYEELLAGFSKPLHLAKMDFNRFPMFGFLFAEIAPGQQEEFRQVLENDLSGLIRTRSGQ